MKHTHIKSYQLVVMTVERKSDKHEGRDEEIRMNGKTIRQGG